MPRTLIGTGDATGTLSAATTGDVTFNGQLFIGSEVVKTFGHDEVLNGVDFDVKEGNTYQVIVNAVFAEDAQATVTCGVGLKSVDIVLTGDAEPPGLDYELAQFHIYA